MLHKIVLGVYIIYIILILPVVGNGNDVHKRLFEPDKQFELRPLTDSHSNLLGIGIEDIESNGIRASASLLYNESPYGDDTPEQKSKAKAFMLSLLLPGLGERYANSYTKSQIFIGTEIVLWAGFLGLNRYNRWRIEDYRAFAASHAGVDLQKKSASYFTDLEIYDSIFDYNEATLRDRNLRDYYLDIEQFYWNWDSDKNRKEFRKIRISADEAYSRSLFAIAAIVANHIVSAIDAMWTVHKYNKKIEPSMGFDVKFDESHTNSMMLSINFYKRF